MTPDRAPTDYDLPGLFALAAHPVPPEAITVVASQGDWAHPRHVKRCTAIFEPIKVRVWLVPPAVPLREGGAAERSHLVRAVFVRGPSTLSIDRDPPRVYRGSLADLQAGVAEFEQTPLVRQLGDRAEARLRELLGVAGWTEDSSGRWRPPAAGADAHARQ